MECKTKIKDLVATSSKDDSLYIYLDDIENFVGEYNDIFDCSIYNNLKTGLVDIYGINYYKPDLVETIISKILSNKTTDYEILIGWLNKAKSYNGFYILGI